MVKILALGDPHGVLPKNLDKIIKRNKVELIVCVGDIPYSPKNHWLKESWENIDQNFVNKSYRDIMKKLCSYRVPVLTLRGNMWMNRKFRNKATTYFRRHKNLINKWTGKEKVLGENFVFFDVVFEDANTPKSLGKFNKKRADRNLKREIRLNNLLKENKDSILISHNPPLGVVDINYSNKHTGSKIIRDAIKKHKPKLVLCGHIHEAKGKGKIGKTPVYNLGWHGDYVVIDSETLKISESNFLK